MYLSRRAEMAEAEVLSSPLKLPAMQSEELVKEAAVTGDMARGDGIVAGAALD